MQATPLFLGACALASIAGVVGGTTINTRPIQRGGIGMEEINRPALAFDPSDTGLSDQVALPDQYAMTTPDGRIEVAELSTRGIYSQRRYGWREVEWEQPSAPAFEEPAADPGWSYTGPEEVGTAEAPEEAVVQTAVMAVQPRVIDVQAELANQ